MTTILKRDPPTSPPHPVMCLCVRTAEWADYINWPYLSGLPLPSPWHLDNKGHIWKSKSAQTPMLIYSCIYKREWVCKKRQNISHSRALLDVRFTITVNLLHAQQALFIYMTCTKDLYYVTLTRVYARSGIFCYQCFWSEVTDRPNS